LVKTRHVAESFAQIAAVAAVRFFEGGMFDEIRALTAVTPHTVLRSLTFVRLPAQRYELSLNPL
jgi:hypothetical protein